MIYIYTPSASTGARELVNTIKELGGKAKRAKTTQQLAQAPPGSLIVGWGKGIPWGECTNRTFLNRKVIGNKFQEHKRLLEKGVPVPKLLSGPKEGFVGRSFNHQGGKDLLAGGGHDYWVERIETIREFRIHVLGGVSIRAGMKVPRDEFPNLHPWIRSYDGGWRLSYGPAAQDHLRQSLRDAAKEAVAALGLDFGAVDVALKPGGGVVVWEVNKAPGLEGGSLKKYAEKLIQLAA